MRGNRSFQSQILLAGLLIYIHGSACSPLEMRLKMTIFRVRIPIVWTWITKKFTVCIIQYLIVVNITPAIKIMYVYSIDNVFIQSVILGPNSCHHLQKFLKKRAKQMPDQRWKQNLGCFGELFKKKFTFLPLALDIDTQKYTPRNKNILKSKKSKKSRSKKMKTYIPKDTQRQSPEDLLNSREKSILIVGKPGIGKTTVVQQMLDHWAERDDRKLDFMFYFDENTLWNTSTTVSSENLLLRTFLMSNPQIKENTEEILQYLQENSERVTIVFDGIRDFQDNKILKEIVEHKLLPEAQIVATCRPERDSIQSLCSRFQWRVNLWFFYETVRYWSRVGRPCNKQSCSLQSLPCPCVCFYGGSLHFILHFWRSTETLHS